MYSDGKLIMSNEHRAKTRACEVDYTANCEFVIDNVDDRQKYELRAVLLDESGYEINHNSICVEVFEDADIPENDDIVLIEKLPEGEYEIAGEKIRVTKCGSGPRHFVSRKTGHKAVEEFYEKDFSYWYDKSADMITPIIDCTFSADGFESILTAANQVPGSDWLGGWRPALACGVKEYEGKKYVICQVDLRCENPIAKRFKKAIYEKLS